MTRADIAAALDALIVGVDPSGAPLSSRSRVLLAQIAADQEVRLADLDRRMRVLEPCPGRAAGMGLAHIFVGQSVPLSCAFCGVVQ